MHSRTVVAGKNRETFFVFLTLSLTGVINTELFSSLNYELTPCSVLQDPGGAGHQGVRPGLVPPPACREAPRGGAVLGVDAARSLPHGRLPLHHRQLLVLLQPRGGKLHADHPALRGTEPRRPPSGNLDFGPGFQTWRVVQMKCCAAPCCGHTFPRSRLWPGLGKTAGVSPPGSVH